MPPMRAPSSAIQTVAFVSLGCPKALIDSETMLHALQEAGYRLVSDHDDADAIVINTCGFLEAAKEESLGAIHEAIARKETGRVQRVVVAGCLPQRHRAKLLDWAPGIDAMIGVFDRDHILDAVRGGGRRADPPCWIAGNALQAARARGLAATGLTVHGADGRGIGYYEDESHRFRLTPRHWAYLRISEGCNQNCAFCTIPSIRGKMRSKPPEVIVREARQLMSEGVFELNLIGEDTTSYGRDIGGRHGGTKAQGHEGAEQRERVTRGDLVGLLEALNAVAAELGAPSARRGGPLRGPGADPTSGGWVRVMYAYPTHFTDEMIDVIARLPNIVNYIDIPLQHITDHMLDAMRRNTTRAQQEALLHKLRDRIPGLAVRTTFITGFPGETEKDHQALLEFIDDFQFDMLGVFAYSREDGTPAGTMDGDPALHVPDEVKERRREALMLTQQRIAFENARYVAEQGCQFDVLIDGEIEGAAVEVEQRGAGEDAGVAPGAWRGGSGRHPSPPTPLPGGEGSRRLFVGRCYHQAPEVDSVTYVESAGLLAPGELVRCTIVDADGYDLIARPTAELERIASLPVVH
ncbi:MAG: radical SAM protein [Planctomycetota bacterium]|nr:radical SAM protein [Planctomycetota bacterium]